MTSKAAASEGPEAYPLGYVEGLNDARTKLADFFSILLVCCHNDGTSRIICLVTMSEPTVPTTDQVLALREEFRHHLELFYAQLKLAPPYESVEKAIRFLTTSIHALPPSERASLATDTTARWRHFRQAFESSGLSKKHRGIIAGLARNRSGLNLPAEYDQFLNLYL